MITDEELIEIINTLGEENILNSSQAKMYSQNIRLSWGGESLSSWNDNLSKKQLQDALLLIEVAIELETRNQFEEARKSYRRAAELLEWLSKASPEFNNNNLLKLIAGSIYQLAHLPAMSLGILKEGTSVSNESMILSSFLRADFFTSLNKSIEFFNIENSDLDGSTNDLLTQELVRVVGLLSFVFLSGKRSRLQIAIEKLEGIINYSSYATPSLVFILVKTLRVVVKRFWDSSVWTRVERMSEGQEDEYIAKLKKFAGSMVSSNRSLLWPSQKVGFEKLATSDSFAICTPTGSGKSTVAEASIIKMLYNLPSSNNDPFNSIVEPAIIYMVPSRALAAEAESNLSKTFGKIDSNVIVTGLYGGNDFRVSESWITEIDRKVIFVCTVEKADAIFRFMGPWLSPRLTGVVIDEAHQVFYEENNYNSEKLIAGESRSLRLEQFVTRLKAQKPNLNIVALSAVASGAENKLAEWVTSNSEEALNINFRTTRQLIGQLQTKADGSSKIKLDILDGKELALSGRSTDAYIPQPFPSLPRVIGRHRSNIFNYGACQALWASMHLAQSGKNTLISITEKISQKLKLYYDLLEEQSSFSSNCPSFFSLPVDEKKVRIYDQCIASCEDYLGEDSFELYFLRIGIAVHHGQLPVKVRRSMTRVIKEGITPIVIATSTLTEGVNLPFDFIILPSLQRFDGGRAKTLEIGEIKNLAGRAGRPGSDGEGIVLFSVPMEATSRDGSNNRTEQIRKIRSYRRKFGSLKRKIVTNQSEGSEVQNSPIKTLIKKMFDMWKDISESNSASDFVSWLESVPENSIPISENSHDLYSCLDNFDSFILSLLVEVDKLEANDLELESFLSDVWAKTYASTITTRPAAYNRIIKARGKAIALGEVGEISQLKGFYRLGLSPREGQRLIGTSDDLLEHLRNVAEYNSKSEVDKYSFIETVVQLAFESRGFDLNSSDFQNWREKLLWWLSVGDSVNPTRETLNSWLKFCSGKFEYEFGKIYGATIASLFDLEDSLSSLEIERWSEVSELPWIAFWIPELLSWGVLDPVIAFLMSTGKYDNRGEAIGVAQGYPEWAQENEVSSENYYNPKNLRKWYYSSQTPNVIERRDIQNVFNVELLLDFTISEDSEFDVIPFVSNQTINWLDPAGYKMASCDLSSFSNMVDIKKFSYILKSNDRTVEVFKR